MEGMKKKKARDGDGGGGRQRCSSDWRVGGGFLHWICLASVLLLL